MLVGENCHLGDLTSPEVGALAAAGAILAVPLGSTEQHGPHLNLSTDTDVAVALCCALARRRGDILIAPAVAYGSSGEHAGFAGTLSIGQAAIEVLVVELVRSAGETFSRVLLVSGHGGNAEPVRRAVATLRAESRDVMLFEPRWQSDLHAGHSETSLQLSQHPDRVDLGRAVVGDTRPLAELWPSLRSGGVRAVTPTGVLGDPTLATAEAGDVILTELTDHLDRVVQRWLAPVGSSRAGSP